MKVCILAAGPSNPTVSWCAIDEYADLLSHYLGVAIVSPQYRSDGLALKLRLGSGWHLADTAGVEGDLLIVIARAPDDLAMIESIPNFRKRFSKIFCWIADSYFENGYTRHFHEIDAVAVTAREDMAFAQRKFGIAVHHQYHAIDALTWLSEVDAPRSIDVIGMGRQPRSYHQALQQRMHRAASPYVYLHSPIGGAPGSDSRLERGMLYKLLQRSRIALAFHMFVEPEGTRPRSMMLTSRWLELLMCGCIVAGRRPVSTMTEEMLDWPGATVELSERADEACDQVHAMLDNGSDAMQQRRTNMREILLRHDWRYRARDLCRLLDIPVPAALDDDLARLAAKAERIAALHG